MTGHPSFGTGDSARLDPAANVPPLPINEVERLRALGAFRPFLHPHDPPMTSLARQAAALCHAPMGLVSVMEADEQRVLGGCGLSFDRVDRCDTICATTILQPDVLVVEDATLDPRFQNLPGVLGPPFARFYAGAPFFDRGGLPLGTVCAVASQPRGLSSRAALSLRRLATLAAAVLEVRLLAASSRDHARLNALILTFVEARSSGD